MGHFKKIPKYGICKKGFGFAAKTKTHKYKALIKKDNITSVYVAEIANFKRKYAKKNILYY